MSFDSNQGTIGQLIYKGNSVAWMHSKAKVYTADLLKAWDALNEFGIYSDGKTHVADAIRQLGQKTAKSLVLGQRTG